MDFLKNLALKIRKIDEVDQYKYFGISLASFILGLFIIWYFTNSRVNTYSDLIKKTLTQRQETQRLISDYKIVKQQQEQVNEILEKNKNFRPIQAYSEIVSKLKLERFQGDAPLQTPGATVDNKTEIEVKVALAAISMKQLTDLLYEISLVEQLFPKNLTIKKNPNTQTVDVDLTIATLEPSTE